MFRQAILVVSLCILPTSALRILIFENAQFVPTNASLKLGDLSPVHSRDECACRCFTFYSNCYTASYIGMNKTCSFFSGKVKPAWLRKMPNMTNASILTFGNESLPVCSTFDFQQPPSIYPTGTGPVGMVSVDFNKDGHLDLAISNQGANSISVLLGVGNGSFQLPAIVTSSNGTSPYWLVADDFNSDGNLDLAICNEGSNTISILLGLNNGSFQSPAISFSSGGTSPSSIIAVDINHDTKTDLVVTNTANDIITVFLAFGNGTFQVPGVHYAAGSRPSSICSGYFNNDSYIALAVVSRFGHVLIIFLGVGNGTFQTNVNYTTGTFPYVIRTGDFNGDSYPDLVVGNFNGNTIQIFTGTGIGTFVTSSSTTYALGIRNPIDIVIRDLDGDAKLDLPVSNQAGNLTVYLGYGNGSFGGTKSYSSKGQTMKGIVAEDFNEDGLNDLAVLNNANNNLAIMLKECN